MTGVAVLPVHCGRAASTRLKERYLVSNMLRGLHQPGVVGVGSAGEKQGPERRLNGWGSHGAHVCMSEMYSAVPSMSTSHTPPSPVLILELLELVQLS